MIIDRKFKILAVNPKTGSVHTDETALLLTARDPATLPAMRAYLAACQELGADAKQIDSVKLLIGRIEAFQAKEGTKIADVSPDEEAGLLEKNT